MSKPIKPGTDNQRPGTYIEVGPRGGKVSESRIVRIDSGDRLPPTQKPGNGWTRKKQHGPHHRRRHRSGGAFVSSILIFVTPSITSAQRR